MWIEPPTECICETWIGGVLTGVSMTNNDATVGTMRDDNWQIVAPKKDEGEGIRPIPRLKLPALPAPG